MTDGEKTLVELATPVVAAVYSDTVSGALREVGKVGVDAVKTIRLALFPLQFAGALQDRLADYIDRAVRAVPEDRRTAPVESLTLQVAVLRTGYRGVGEVVEARNNGMLGKSGKLNVRLSI